MILYEYEGKKLLQQAGINTPKSHLIESPDQQINLSGSLIFKAQVLSGKRAEVGGIIKTQNSKLKIQNSLKELFSKTINKEKVEKVLVEEVIEFEGPEYYLSISYDTNIRGPILTISNSGGTGIEDRDVSIFPIDLITITCAVAHHIDIPQDVIDKLIQVFFASDCLLLEINPLVKTKDGKWFALDAKIKLDDDARVRHEEWNFTPRSVPGRMATNGEIEAKKIDEGDHRGTAGAAYFDLEGDIAVLSSGGGVSLTAMDSLISYGGKPANFTEYSGNPPKEKVVKLTKIVLSKPNIHGLWVIGTVAANFTDIYETLLGLIEGLREAERELNTKFKFPIVIRRGGPREEEAFEMLKEVKDFSLILQGEEISIAQSAKKMFEEAKKYAVST